MRDGNTVIIFTERGGLMNDACSIGICNVGINKNAESFIFKLDIVSLQQDRSSK